MKSVWTDFQTRVREVNEYFNFVHVLDGREVTIFWAEEGYHYLNNGEHESLVRTLKANGFLLLYNLVESTMTNAIEAVFEEFRALNVSFDDCRDEIRRIVITNLKTHSADKVFNVLAPISQRILTETFNKERMFSGNVDARKIREVAQDYGFQPPLAKGINLLTVKSNRNDLAHGTKAFFEVGRNYVAPEMVKMKDEVIHYLREVLTNVNAYLVNRDYLAGPAPPVIPTDPDFSI